MYSCSQNNSIRIFITHIAQYLTQKTFIADKKILQQHLSGIRDSIYANSQITLLNVMLKVTYEDFSMINFNTEMHAKQINGQHLAKMEHSSNLYQRQKEIFQWQWHFSLIIWNNWPISLKCYTVTNWLV